MCTCHTFFPLNSEKVFAFYKGRIVYIPNLNVIKLITFFPIKVLAKKT